MEESSTLSRHATVCLCQRRYLSLSAYAWVWVPVVAPEVLIMTWTVLENRVRRDLDLVGLLYLSALPGAGKP